MQIDHLSITFAANLFLMHILQVTFNLSPGGAERFVVDLSNELSKTDEVVVMTILEDLSHPEESQFYLSDLNSNVVYKNLGIAQGGGFSIRVLWRIYKAIKNEKADIVHLHVHGVVNFCIIAIFLLCWSTTIVQTIHTEFSRHDSIVYKFLFNTIGRLHKMRWVALSKSNYEDMQKAYPFLLSRRIDNGRAPVVPTQSYDKVKEELRLLKNNEDTKVYLHVARCIEVKNQQMLVDAFNQFVQDGHNAILLMIGSHFDSELGQTIAKSASSSIHFLGTRHNISDYMLNADCFCLTSIYEGLPIVILEAMLSGTPVVSTPVKGVLDVIKEGVTGVISKDFTKEEYIRALEYSFNHLEELRSSSFAEKDKCPYSITECAKKYREFYVYEK